MEKTLNVGIIGCGGIANTKHLPALSKIKEVRLVAFCDIIVERAEKAAKKFGAEGAKVYEDYKELLKDESIDVVHVLTPNRSHGFITVDALEAGKHVMCEKPMAKTAADAKAMVDAAKRTGKLLTIGYQNRQNASSIYAKALCDNGELGELYYGKAVAIRRRAVPTWGVFLNAEEQGGGPLIDIGTHALDLTLYLMNNYEPKMVVGNTFRKLAEQTGTANAWGDWDPNEFTVEDSAFGYVVMKNGAVVTLESSWALNVSHPVEAAYILCGDKGGIDNVFNGFRVNYVKNNRQVIETPDFDSGGVDFFEGDANPGSHDIEARIWINAVLGKGELCVKPEQAYVVTQILEAIYTSAKTGQPVYFD